MGDPQVTIGFNTKIVKSWMILDTSILGHLDTNILRMIVDYHDPINWESTNQFYFGMTWGCEHCSHEQRWAESQYLANTYFCSNHWTYISSTFSDRVEIKSISGVQSSAIVSVFVASFSSIWWGEPRSMQPAAREIHGTGTGFPSKCELFNCWPVPLR